MADPLSLTLGIIPLCLTAIKGVILLQSKLKILRHSGEEIRKVRKKLRIQGDCFRDEIHRLLLKLLDYDVAASMMNDENHREWHSLHLEEKTAKYLAGNYASYLDDVKEWREIFTTLVDQLPPSEMTVPIRDALLITVRKKEYVESLEALKESCGELKRIRKMAKTLRGHLETTGRLPLPAGYSIARNISSSLHELLQTKIFCNAHNHSGHNIKLILSSTDEADPRLNLFLEQISDKGSILERTLEPLSAGFNDIPDYYLDPLNSDSNPEPEQELKRRRVRDTHPSHQTAYIRVFAPKGNKPEEQDSEDLMQVRIKCEELISRPHLPTSEPALRSLGCLAIIGNRKLVLYQGLHGLSADCSRLDPTHTTPLSEILNLPKFDAFADKGRVRMAITLAKSMLKFHSTPWWPRGETLKQVHIFKDRDLDLLPCLDTLHLSLELTQRSSTMGNTSTALALQNETNNGSNSSLSDSIRYAMEDHGIRNLTLYGLGVALLQIGLWEHVPWEDHVQVRRKVARLSHLGKGYRDATKKLIYCDFGLAIEQLDDPQLQSAIFSHVVGELESILGIA